MDHAYPRNLTMTEQSMHGGDIAGSGFRDKITEISSQLCTNPKRGSKLTNKGVILDKGIAHVTCVKKYPLFVNFYP